MKILLIILSVILAVLTIVAIADRKWLEVTHIAVDAGVRKNIRLVHISDLHDYAYGKNNEKLLSVIEKEKPDYICITGDLINSAGNKVLDTLAFLEQLKKTAEVIYVQGNHELIFGEVCPADYEGYVKELKNLGIILLNDSCYEKEGLIFHGYTNKMCQYGKFKKLYRLGPDEMSGEIEPPSHKNLSNSEEMCYNILLAHNPIYFKTYCEWGADLVLSGHLHGGMIRLPFAGGIISPQTFFGTSYTGGLYKEGDRYMYVSRGLGLHTIHVRIFNRPELAVIDLVTKKEEKK